MSNVGFKIYNASAGSGKTYQLTKNYLTQILAPKSKLKYAQLLALTFTNKAVGEMKERILQSLHEFSMDNLPKSSQGLFEDIKNHLNFNSEQLRQKAQNTLKELLHNYAFFEISTIDKFNHKIIRTFARDLKIAQNFEVELDTDSLLNQAVARVLNQAGSNKELTDFLIDFVIEKIDDNKSWNIAYDLNEIGKLLFREQHIPHLKKLTTKNISDFVGLKKKIATDINTQKNSVIEKAKKNLELIAESGLEFGDFSRKYFPKFMEQISQGNLEINFDAGWKQNFETTPLYNKSCPENIKAIIDELQSEFSKNFNYIKHAFENISFLSKAYKKIVPLTLINEISKELKKIQEEQNLLNISEFNTIISNEIKNQPVPFIYERLGEKYRHYFIDEFQDTSQLQWENLIPLISNALESENELGQKGSLLLVGDVKQAIYRWRGGEASQFLNLSLKTEKAFVVKPSVENLDKNWRSAATLVDFNNDFFSFIATKLKNNIYQHLYEEGNQQEKNDQLGGFIELSFLEEDKEIDAHPHSIKTLENINAILSKGYTYKDICILVRSNNQGVVIADFLSKNEIPIVSAEALLLKNSTEVNFLVALMYLIEQPEIKEHQFTILEYLAKDETIKHDFISKNIGQFPMFLKDVFDFNMDEAKLMTPLDMVEVAISKFDLAPNSNAYISYFLDEVFAYGKKQNLSIFDFLQFWERKKNKLSIAAPDDLDAVNIMTIHKSKGLEFPFVIIPFAAAKIDEKRKSNDLWVPVNEEEFYGFNELMLKNSSDLKAFSEEAAVIYKNESENAELDDFNVLYVSLTRAINGLFVITAPPSKNSKGDNNMSFASLFADYLKEKDFWSESQTTYSFGELTANHSCKTETIHQLAIPYIYTSKDDAQFNMVTSKFKNLEPKQEKAIHIGNLLHQALSLIYTEDDIESVLSNFVNNGEINQKEQSYLERTLNKVVTHELLNKFYTKGLTVYNEIEILNPNKSLVRLDRLVIDDMSACIIDYKTGEPHTSHKKQLDDYEEILLKMGYFVTDKILVYIDENIKPIFV